MIFPILRTDEILQVNDKIRFDASETFINGSTPAISGVEIEPDTSLGFISVYQLSQQAWYLDWIYLTAGSKVVRLKITAGQGGSQVTETITKTVTVLTAADDYLFSSDSELRSKEHDILRWLPDGYSSWNHVHRQCQKNILDWFDEIRLFKEDGTRWAAEDVVVKAQVRRIATNMALRMIFSSISNQVGDIFDQKAQMYLSMERDAKNRNYITLDFDGDGQAESDERQELRTMTMVRR
jgi:hypothetical protein